MRALNWIVSVTAAIFIGCGEHLESRYETYADLERAGAGARSWLPVWLPSTATDIREWHDLDTNATRAVFTVPNAASLLAGCKPSRFVRNPGSAPWWPSDRVFEGLQHFRCEERQEFADGHEEVRPAGAALDPRAGRIFFWR